MIFWHAEKQKFRTPIVPDTPVFTTWCYVLLISIVTFTCAASLGFDTSDEVWVTIAASISLVLSLSVFLGYNCFRQSIEGSMVEGFIALVNLLAWIACIPSVMSITNAANDITNVNLYFAIWISFAAAVYQFIQMLPPLLGERSCLPEDSSKFSRLVGLVIASIVLLVSASEFSVSNDCTASDSGSTCQRNQYAIFVGFTGMTIPVISILLTAVHRMNMLIDVILSTLLFIVYIFGVGFATFGDGPASLNITNIYFSPWVGFALSSSLAWESIITFVNYHFEDDEPDDQESTLPPVTEDAGVEVDDSDSDEFSIGDSVVSYEMYAGDDSYC